jgi:hypothetical protein
LRLLGCQYLVGAYAQIIMTGECGVFFKGKIDFVGTQVVVH